MVSLFQSWGFFKLMKKNRKNMFESWPHPKLQGLESKQGLPTQKEHPFVINDPPPPPPSASTNPIFALQRPKEGHWGQWFLWNEKFPPCVLRSAGQPCFRDFSLPSERGDVFRHCSKASGYAFLHTMLQMIKIYSQSNYNQKQPVEIQGCAHSQTASFSLIFWCKITSALGIYGSSQQNVL